jgi:hypothetical protein
MRDLHWIDPASSLNGLHDLVDEDGTILGYVGNTTTGVRGYVIERRPGRCATFASIVDHPTDEAARAHVEAEVARIYGGDGAA